MMMQLLQTLDTGLVLVDTNYSVQLWNSFMENHSGIPISDARNQNLFTLFPDLPENWLKGKIDSVFTLQTRTFCTWEEHPRLFNFKSTRPLTGHSELMFQNITLIPLTGLDQKVSQVCLLIYDVTEIATKKIELESANKSLQQLSRIDKLTGLFNRGYWEECLETEFNRSKRSTGQASLALFDIDHFKRLNDTHGHLAGDKMLVGVARAVSGTQRLTDIAGRYGGEEFGLILPDTSEKNAWIVAERLRKSIADTVVEWEEQQLRVTVSLGICEYSENMASYQSWIESADKALYEAKNKGRNRTVIYQETVTAD
jgi:diguanylate cyclase